MANIILIADDMTGMLDTAVQFAKSGIPTTAYSEDVTVDELKNCKTLVVAVTTESRSVTKEEAYRRVCDILEKAKKAGITKIFKKTDSVLRGHLGAEFEAIIHTWETDHIFFFPAYPELGRTTKDGIQYVNGIPVSECEINTDQIEMIGSSYIPELISAETTIPVHVIKADENWRKKEKNCIYVFDAMDSHTIRNKVKILVRSKEVQVFAGCAGLAQEVAQVMDKKYDASSVANPNKAMFAVCGSMNKVTRNQVSYASEHGYEYFPIEVGDLIKKGTETKFYMEEVVNEIKEKCRQKKSIVIAPVCQEDKNSRLKEQSFIRKEIVDRLNRILIMCMDELDGYTLFHTGGDTLSSFVSMANCKKINICGELYSGITLNRFRFQGKEKFVISKSGGFGTEDILLKCLEEKEKTT